MATKSKTLHFGDWKLESFPEDPNRQPKLYRGIDYVRLGRSQAGVLAYIAEHHYKLDAREVIDSVWPHKYRSDHKAGELALKQTVRRLRKTLGDSTRRPFTLIDLDLTPKAKAIEFLPIVSEYESQMIPGNR